MPLGCGIHSGSTVSFACGGGEGGSSLGIHGCSSSICMLICCRSDTVFNYLVSRLSLFFLALSVKSFLETTQSRCFCFRLGAFSLDPQNSVQNVTAHWSTDWSELYARPSPSKFTTTHQKFVDFFGTLKQPLRKKSASLKFIYWLHGRSQTLKVFAKSTKTIKNKNAC